VEIRGDRRNLFSIGFNAEFAENYVQRLKILDYAHADACEAIARRVKRAKR